MNFLELVNQRQSVRKFDNLREIEKDNIERILEAGRLSPSACNSQPWTFVVVDEPDLRKKVAKATHSTLINLNGFVIDSTLLIVIVLEKPKLVTQIGSSIKNKEYPLIDIGIAASQMCLQAQYDGVGSCMLGWFDEKKIKNLLQIPSKKTIGLIIALGYPVENYHQRLKIRKPISEVVRNNKY